MTRVFIHLRGASGPGDRGVLPSQKPHVPAVGEVLASPNHNARCDSDFVLAVITFFAGFIPIVGAFTAGFIAVMVALVANGFRDIDSLLADPAAPQAEVH